MTWNTHMLRINILFPCSTVSWHIDMLVCSQPSTSYLRTKQIDNCSLAAYYWLLSYKTLFTLCDSVIHPKQRLKSFGNCVVNGVEERPSNESFHLNLKFQLVLLSVNRHTLTLKFPKNEAFHLEFHMVFFSLPFFEKKKHREFSHFLAISKAIKHVPCLKDQTTNINYFYGVVKDRHEYE